MYELIWKFLMAVGAAFFLLRPHVASAGTGAISAALLTGSILLFASAFGLAAYEQWLELTPQRSPAQPSQTDPAADYAFH